MLHCCSLLIRMPTWGGLLQADFDDANVPSLLSIPLLGYRYNPEIYAATRDRILTKKNPSFFAGNEFSGIGSPHTPEGMAWPLALSVQGLTSHSPKERADMLRTLLKLQCDNGLMHESGTGRVWQRPAGGLVFIDHVPAIIVVGAAVSSAFCSECTLPASLAVPSSSSAETRCQTPMYLLIRCPSPPPSALQWT